MTMDFSGYGDQNDFSELIPAGALARAILKIRPFNLDEGIWETTSKNPKDPNNPSKYLDCELTLSGGKYDKRKMWTKIGVAGSTGYINMGGRAIRAILEYARGASDQNPQGYALGSYGELDGTECAIKVGVESSANYPDKNDVAVFLSPLQNKRDWDRFLAGDHDPDPNAVRRERKSGGQQASSAVVAQAPRWVQGQQTQAAAPAAPPAAPPPPNPPVPANDNTPQQPAPAPTGMPPWLARGQGNGPQQ